MSESSPAPEIDQEGFQWFNIESPLSISDLRGKFVILDFWTFCCINCIHVLATLRELEMRFPDEVVIIGVHSPKFTAEKEVDNLRHAIARHNIRHPVIQDSELRLWRAYGVSAWPTMAFISPDGVLMGLQAGEVPADRLISVLEELITRAREDGVLSPKPFDLTETPTPGKHLAFPSKIKPGMRNGQRIWVVADSGHHQIIVIDKHGCEQERFGAGEEGYVDAPTTEARFSNPQGLIATDTAIYVADTGNHAIRRIDFSTGMIDTLSGTGERGGRLGQTIKAKNAALASVWDLDIDGNRLYFANAGSHQIGLLDLQEDTVTRLAGDGGEDIVDGIATEALLAQPSGIALNVTRDTLYFVDSETSSLRSLTLNGTPEVSTLVGKGLFDFGHRNGVFEDALLQHPLGVVWHSGKLLIADSYNGRVRIADPPSNTVSDLDEGGFTCEDMLCLPINEPAGITVDSEGNILLADTNNHRIIIYRPSERTYNTWFE